MSRSPLRVPAVIAVCLAFGGSPPHAEEEIYPCPDASGNVVYLDEPCPDVPARAAKTAKPAEPMKDVKAVGATDPVKTPAPRGVSKPVATPVVKPAAKTAATFPEPPRSPAPAPEREPVPSGPVPPDFASPERTWATFTAAMRKGDRAGALACLSSSALEDFGPLVESLSIQALRETVDAVTRIEVEGQAGPYWSIRAERAGARPKWIFFERTATGAWRIAAI